MNKLILFLVCLCPGLLLGYEWEKTPSSVSLKDNDRVIWTHVHDPNEAKPFFHPLNTPSGIALTDLKPKDHVWHRGLWFSWKYINGVNYWEEEKGKSQGTTKITNVDVRTNADFSAVITLEIQYFQKAEEILMHEKRVLNVSAPKSGSYIITWDSFFNIIQNVDLGRTPLLGEKGGKAYGGYAGISVRAARELRKSKEWQFIKNDGGSIKHGEKAHSVSFKGPDAAITIEPRSSHEYSWYLTKGMPYFSPALLFEKSIKLVKGDTKKVSYKIKVEDTQSK